MPARVNKIRHDENTRAKIQAANILNRLQAFFMNENDPVTKKPVELTNTQVNLGIALLKKVIPDLSSVELSGEVSSTNVVRAPAIATGTPDWQSQHVPIALRPTEH